MSAKRTNHSWLSMMIVLTACGASAAAPIDCGEGGEYVVVEDVRYCVYSDDIVIIGGFDCPPELPHHFGGDPAVICSDHAPVSGPLPAPICALNPRACEEPTLDAGAPVDSGACSTTVETSLPYPSDLCTDANAGATRCEGGCGWICEGDPSGCWTPICDGPCGGLDGGPADSGPPPSPVGGSCLPASVPSGGFDSAEVYVETISAGCESNVCIVYELDGDPRPGCSGADCADPAEADARVFCSCRCNAEPGQPTCTCPGGMRCQADLVTVGGAGTIGGYCVPEPL